MLYFSNEKYSFAQNLYYYCLMCFGGSDIFSCGLVKNAFEASQALCLAAEGAMLKICRDAENSVCITANMVKHILWQGGKPPRVRYKGS